jgi:hypothetical protein
MMAETQLLPDLSIQRRQTIEIAGLNTEYEGVPLLPCVTQLQRWISGIPDDYRVALASDFHALTS